MITPEEFERVAKAQEAKRDAPADIELTYGDVDTMYRVLLERVRTDKKRRLEIVRHDDLLDKLAEYLGGT